MVLSLLLFCGLAQACGNTPAAPECEGRKTSQYTGTNAKPMRGAYWIGGKLALQVGHSILTSIHSSRQAWWKWWPHGVTTRRPAPPSVLSSAMQITQSEPGSTDEPARW